MRETFFLELKLKDSCVSAGALLWQSITHRRFFLFLKQIFISSALSLRPAPLCPNPVKPGWWGGHNPSDRPMLTLSLRIQAPGGELGLGEQRETRPCIHVPRAEIPRRGDSPEPVPEGASCARARRTCEVHM